MRELIKLLSKQQSLLKKISQSLKNINRDEANISKKVSIAITEIRQIERDLKNVQLDSSLKAQIKSEIDAVKLEISNLERQAKMEFGKELSTILKDKGFTLEGNYPKLRASIYTFVIDIAANKATIYYGPEIEKIDTCKAIPAEVASMMFNSNEKITQRMFDNTNFLENLYKAYHLCLVQNNKKIGDEVSISEITSAYAFTIQDKRFKTNPLKKHYTEYDRILFSYDLSRLRERIIDGFEAKLITARRNETKNRLNVLWIPPLEGKGLGETISNIKFTEAR